MAVKAAVFEENETVLLVIANNSILLFAFFIYFYWIDIGNALRSKNN